MNSSTLSLSPKRQKADVLLVEDNAADVYVTRLAFAKSRVGAQLHVVSDGDEAMDFLLQRGRWISAPKPDLVLLDLNLPRKTGREVLSEMRSHPDLRRIPVVVLSSSQADDDVVDVYDLGANAYVSKPSDPAILHEIAVTIEDLWFVLGHLPPR